MVLILAIAGIPPQHCLPIMLDVGTNNEEISSNPLYIGLRQSRVTGKEYDEFIDEFMDAVVQRFGWECLIQFEDFASHNAYRLLERYQKTYCTFNDDIQGTAAVVLAGLFGALRITNTRLIDNTYLFVGAGQAACGIADLVTHAMVREGVSVEEARSKIWMYDVHGLIVEGRTQGDLDGPKASYVKKGKAIKDLAAVVDYVKPSILMGASGVGRLFHEAVLKKMAQINERPVIFALSNPTSRAECTAEEAYRETDGRCIFASGSPFKPVVYKDKTFHPGQGNNAYIFPAVALATVACSARHVEEDMFLIAAQKLGSLVNEEDLNDGRVYPPVPKIHEVTVKIATHLAEHLYATKKAWNYPEPENKEEFIRMQLYDTSYEYFGPKTWKWPEQHSTARTVPSVDENINLQSGACFCYEAVLVGRNNLRLATEQHAQTTKSNTLSASIINTLVQDNPLLPQFYMTAQAFRSDEQQQQSGEKKDIYFRSILSHLLLEAIICYLENQRLEKFARMFLGEFDQPETIWSNEMRRLMIEKIAVYFADYTPRLMSNISAIYSYCTISIINYPQLENELFCNTYY
ncbi:unnamed protein product [Rotaria sp. Silwood2]|nr:unnamed protein product [Rotaria sp. Silwood2]